jgi:hypothetical protein
LGASDWHYVVGYQDDVSAAFTALQETVLAEGNYYQGSKTYASMSDLLAAKHTDEFWGEGTHSILDMMEIVGPDGKDETATVRMLRDDEVQAHFGTNRPTTADYERFLATDWYTNRWESRATVLYKDGQPAELAFWGISGD